MVKALHVFLLVDGDAVVRHQGEPPSHMQSRVGDLVSLLVLVKSAVKACCLPHEQHGQLVRNMLLLPVGPGTAMLNLLQVSHMPPCAFRPFYHHLP